MWHRQFAGTLIIAGIAGEVAFEVYAWLISPLLFGVALAPANLVAALSQMIFGVSLSYWLAFVIHFVTGAIVFPAFVLLIYSVMRTHLIVSGIIAGVVLWFVAQGVFATAVGRSFMMGFGDYTQSSFVAHVGMTTLMAWVMRKLGVSGLRNATAETTRSARPAA